MPGRAVTSGWGRPGLRRSLCAPAGRIGSGASRLAPGCVLRRPRRGIGVRTRPRVAPVGLSSRQPRSRAMMTYAEARDALVMQLRQDAAAHEAEQYDAIGRRFDAIEYRFPRGTAPELGRLHIALTFWDGWVHARNHGWPPGPIPVAEWPGLARDVAADLQADRDLPARTV